MMIELLIFLYIIIWFLASYWQVGVIHCYENKEYTTLNNKPRYFPIFLETALFIFPSVIVTIKFYGREYQKPVKGVTYK